MATETSVEARDVEQVRIPSELHASLDDFLSGLKLSILDRAVRRARKRKREHGACTVTKEDLVASARATLTEAASGLEQRLAPQDSCYVRNAS
jgi:hypothetical protein